MIRKGLAVLVASSAVAAALLVPSTASASVADSKCWNYKTSERAFAKKNNAARVNAGIGKLSLDPELSRVAMKHTKEMVSASDGDPGADDLFHSTAEQLKRRVTGQWTLLGENVGVGGSVSSLHGAFMDSPLHRANMMNAAFKHVGVGVIKKGDEMFVTVIFSAGGDPGTSLSMPKC